MNSSIKLVIFDLDDTLIRSFLNYKKLKDEVLSYIDPALHHHLEKASILEALDFLKQQSFSDYLKALKRVRQLEVEGASRAIPIDGSGKIIDYLLSKNIVIAGLTNNSRPPIDIYIKKFPFINKLNKIITRDDNIRPKPDPHGVLTLIDFFNKTNADITKRTTIYVGDSWLDALVAQKANVKFIWFKSRPDIRIDRFPSKPTITITKLEDLKEIIK